MLSITDDGMTSPSRRRSPGSNASPIRRESAGRFIRAATPFTVIVPLFVGSAPTIVRLRLVQPEPSSPNNATVSPSHGQADVAEPVAGKLVQLERDRADR